MCFNVCCLTVAFSLSLSLFRSAKYTTIRIQQKKKVVDRKGHGWSYLAYKCPNLGFLKKTYFKEPYIYTYIHTHTHIYIHTHTYKYIYTHTHTHIHTYIHTHIHTTKQTNQNFKNLSPLTVTSYASSMLLRPYFSRVMSLNFFLEYHQIFTFFDVIS